MAIVRRRDAARPDQQRLQHPQRQPVLQGPDDRRDHRAGRGPSRRGWPSMNASRCRPTDDRARSAVRPAGRRRRRRDDPRRRRRRSPASAATTPADAEVIDADRQARRRRADRRPLPRLRRRPRRPRDRGSADRATSPRRRRDRLERALRRGFTTVRDVAGGDLGLARALDEGLIDGPRYLFAGRALTQTGGHGDPRPGGLDLCCGGRGHLSEVVDGVDDLRRAVRERFRTGSHLIKVFASGGVVSPTDPLRLSQYSAEELRAVCDEAAPAQLLRRRPRLLAGGDHPRGDQRCALDRARQPARRRHGGGDGRARRLPRARR